MRYLYAKELHNGDEIISKEDRSIFIVKSIELFGQFKKVKISCMASDGSYHTLLNDEIE